MMDLPWRPRRIEVQQFKRFAFDREEVVILLVYEAFMQL